MLLCFALSFINCEKDDDVITKPVALDINQKKPVIKDISFEEFSKNVLAKKSFTNISKSNIVRETKNTISHRSQEGFEIDTTDVTYMESADGLYHSYTFYVTNTDANSGLENVFFSLQEDGSYKTFLAFYDITDDEIEQMNLGEQISITNKWSFTEISEDQILNPNARIFYDSNSGCWKREVYYPGRMCSMNIHWWFQYNECSANRKPTKGETVVSTISCNAIVGQGTDDNGGTNPNDTSTNDPSGGLFGDSSSPKGIPEIPVTTVAGECIDEDAIANLVSVLSLSSTIESCLSGTDDETCEKVSRLNSYVLSQNIKNPLLIAPAIGFAKEAAFAICNGGEVDYEDKIILDSTFVNNLKAKCVYDKLKSQNSTLFNNIINNHFESSKISHIRFKVTPTPNGQDAYTKGRYNAGQTFFEIQLDPSALANYSAMEVALALIHEPIHAEILDRCVQLGIIDAFDTLGNPNFTNSSSTYTTYDTLFALLVKLYRNHIGVSSQWNHNMFTVQTYRDEMAQNLSSIHYLLDDPLNQFQSNVNYDVNNVGGLYTVPQLMEYVSWIGLEGTEEYINTITANSTELAKKVYIENSVKTLYTHNCN